MTFGLRLLLIILLAAPALAGEALTALFPPPARPVAALTPLVQPQQHYGYERMLADARRLAETYPGLIAVTDIGRSVFGRRLIAIRLGRGDVAITLNGAHHAREWITTPLLMAMLDRYALAYYRGELLDGYDVYALLNRVSIWAVPMVNPDGVELAQRGAASAPDPAAVIALNGGSRDFRAWKANGRGVDLNRQYPAEWASITHISPRPGPTNYRGAAPLSEPEARAMADFATAHPFALHAALHTAGEVIFWYFYQTGAARAACERLARCLGALTGYALMPAHGYESGGGYKDWVVQRLGVPAFTVEVGRYTWRNQVPASEFPRIWAQTRTLGLLLAQEALQPGRGAGIIHGYLDGRLAASADHTETVKATLMDRVHRGDAIGATIANAGHTLWRYPDGTLYRVVVNGRTVGVYPDAEAAKTALTAALAEDDAPGGFVVTHHRLLVDQQGAGTPHEITLTAEGAATIDGAPLPLPERPTERDNRRYVPAALFIAMDATATFDPQQHTLTLMRPDGTLLLLHGSALALHGDTPLRLDGPVVTTRGITMVPLRGVAEALGGCVTVDPKTGAISVRWYSEL
jgi:hypothetical protein